MSAAEFFSMIWGITAICIVFSIVPAQFHGGILVYLSVLYLYICYVEQSVRGPKP